MAIIAFWSNEEKQTGQTMATVALATRMAIEHNYRILTVSTAFDEKTLENCYWNMNKMDNLVKNLNQNKSQVGIESGVEGLIKIINSNKTASNIVANYTKIVFNNRLDVLCAPITKKYEEYKQIAHMYPTVLETANRGYDFVLVDISRKLPEEQIKQILELSDLIVVNMSQNVQKVDDFVKLRESNDFFKKNNILLNIGRYDQFSKYNIKNISRYMNEKQDVHATIYNTLFFEASIESNVAELFLRLRKLDEDDRNLTFIKEVDRLIKDMIYKIKELQIKL